MTDKVQKIKDWISKEQDGLMNAQGNFEYPEHEGAYHILCNLDVYIDSLQEEPNDVDAQIKSQNEAIKQLNKALNSMEHGGHLPEMMTAAESLGISEEEYDEIVDECIYGKEPELVDVDDLPKEEPVSDDLEEAVDIYLTTYFGSDREKQDWPFLKKMAIHFAEWQKQKDSIPVSEDLEEAAKNHAVERYRTTRDRELAEKCKWSFKAGAKWQKAHNWKPADGDDIPEIDMEVIVLIQDYSDDKDHLRVALAHRPRKYAKVWNSDLGEEQVVEIERYDKGCWNIPNVKWWLDIEKLPNMDD